MAARSLPTLLAVFLFLTSFLTTETWAWYCEGRTCGITLGRCCCPGHATARQNLDNPDYHGGGRAERDESALSVCSSACDCAMVVSQAADERIASTGPMSASPHPVLWPSVHSVYVGPAAEGSVSRRPETGGPPLKAPTLVAPSLRAPPGTRPLAFPHTTPGLSARS